MHNGLLLERWLNMVEMSKKGGCGFRDARQCVPHDFGYGKGVHQELSSKNLGPGSEALKLQCIACLWICSKVLGVPC